MSRYRRLYVPGATYFFTVVTHGRAPLLAGPDAVARLREALRYAQVRRPLRVEAMVVLPDHLHCVWTLGEDTDYSVRWQMVKTRFSRGLDAPLRADGGKAVWQPRFWEHWIRDEEDLRRHLDYVHFNPVKHGLARTPAEWPYGSFASFVRCGWYAPDWGGTEPEAIRGLERE
jgi:putative transposase